MDLLYDLTAAIVGFMQSGPPFPAFFVYIAVAGIPVILLHELGHALAASQRLGADVEVSVGTTGQLANLRLGQITASINALSLPGRAAGIASFDDSRATARDVLWVAVAGPLASLAGAVATGMLLAAAPESGVAHDLLWTATLGGVLGFLNLVPFEFQERRSGPTVRSDGHLALDALRIARALR
jgi:membrane-associated protease RseP (regulator of RpoE activity)